MAFESLNLIKDLLGTSLFGHTYLLGLFIASFFVILLLVARSFPETALMIPFPLLVALSQSGIIPNWIEPMLYIMTSFYFATVILVFTGLKR